MAGRKPKPTALKKLEGNPGKRPLPEEPKGIISVQCPKAPSHLTREAKKEWNRVAPMLHSIGLLSELDVAALAVYCESYAQMVMAQRVINEKGIYYVRLTKDGEQVLTMRPEQNVVQACIKNIKSFCTEFGMTASSRSRMILPGDCNEADAMEEFIK